MLPTANIFGVISSLLTLTGGGIYIVNIIHKKIQPAQSTWIIWTLVNSCVFASYVVANLQFHSANQLLDIVFILGKLPTTWFILGNILNCGAIMIIAFYYGTAGWTIIDKVCLGATLLSLVVWYLTGSALSALLMNMIIDLIGAAATIYSCYTRQSKEVISSWIFFSLSAFVALGSIRQFSFSEAALPLYILLSNITIIIVILLTKQLAKSTVSTTVIS